MTALTQPTGGVWGRGGVGGVKTDQAAFLICINSNATLTTRLRALKRALALTHWARTELYLLSYTTGLKHKKRG